MYVYVYMGVVQHLCVDVFYIKRPRASMLPRRLAMVFANGTLHFRQKSFCHESILNNPLHICVGVCCQLLEVLARHPGQTF